MSSGKDPFSLFDRAVTPALGLIAAVVLFVLMALTFVDVLGRYFFSRPVFGAFELTEMLLAALIFAALPLVTLRGEHITVDLLDPVTPRWVLRIQHVCACLVGFGFSAYLAWRLWLRAVNMDAAGETTALFKFKLAYLTYSMSLLMALTAIALLAVMLRPPQRSAGGEV